MVIGAIAASLGVVIVCGVGLYKARTPHGRTSSGVAAPSRKAVRQEPRHGLPSAASPLVLTLHPHDRERLCEAADITGYHVEEFAKLALHKASTSVIERTSPSWPANIQ
ncbi:hypothetical protein ACU4GI_33155 [Cupriavidus basilensis]